jgi:hypothetical protein
MNGPLVNFEIAQVAGGLGCTQDGEPTIRGAFGAPCYGRDALFSFAIAAAFGQTSRMTLWARKAS